MRPGAARVLLCLLAVGCATTSLPPVTSQHFAPEEDERRMWARAAEEQRKIAESGVLYRDGELEAYLGSVARKLQPPEVFKAIPFTIRVVRDRQFNASAAPNGVIYLHSGLLAQMDNEAQLATLLGHEMTHATHRHAIRDFRDSMNKTAFFATVSVTLGGVPLVGGLTSLATAVGTAAAITGYSRDLEREADREGLKLMVQAGYDPTEAPKLFALLKAEREDGQDEEAFFYASHPRLRERIETYEALLATEYAGRVGGRKNTEGFRQKIYRVVLDNTAMELKAGRFAHAQRGAEKALAIAPKDARGHYLLGEVSRQRGGDGDAAKAEAHYRKAVAIDPSYPDPHRGIGLLQVKRGEGCLAKKSLERYLVLAPRAPDRTYIEGYMQQCKP